MKNFLLLMVVAILSSFLVPLSAFAQVVPVEGFEWLNSVILFLQSIPAVGEYLVKAFEFAAIIATALTSLSMLLKGVIEVIKVPFKFAQAQDYIEKIEDFEKKVLPWIQYLSMFNVQKKK